mmetsp:Transcript_3560/g.8500  ORF Transcript_3560/g.8500 Transcript_3560/m.8500 type:complete len:157 (-) Transcript_3560:649-1119(-)
MSMHPTKLSSCLERDTLPCSTCRCLIPGRISDTECHSWQAIENPTNTDLDYFIIAKVHRSIELRIQSYQTREEAIASVAAEGFSHLLCHLVWEGLEARNPSFFAAYEAVLRQRQPRRSYESVVSTSESCTRFLEEASVLTLALCGNESEISSKELF